LLSCSVAAAGAPGAAAQLSITNDLPTPWGGEVNWSLERLDGEAVTTGSVTVEARGLATTAACQIDVPATTEGRRSLVLVAELVEAGSRRSLVVTPFVPDKHLALRPPTLEVAVEAAAEPARAVIRLRSDMLARWVELSLDGADVIFSDNYFDLPARRQIEVSFALPADWSIELARQALRVRSVVDTYA
jgi:beta-mannosidase